LSGNPLFRHPLFGHPLFGGGGGHMAPFVDPLQKDPFMPSVSETTFGIVDFS
jgi:hypothetical protein